MAQISADEISQLIREQIENYEGVVEVAEVGSVISLGDGIARLHGLEKVMAGEMLDFPHNVAGIAMNLEEDEVGAVLLGDYTEIKEGDEVRRTGRIISVPVGDALIGRVVAAGRTVGELEEALRARLLDGYFRNPRVTVAVAEYRSQQVFVMGEISNPGAYPLAAETSLIEILALAGSLTPQASGIAVIVRAGDGAGGPSSDNGGREPSPAGGSDTVRVNLRDLEGGDLSRNIKLRDGDTVFIPRAEVVYVVGEVRDPGSYRIQEGMTVLQALSLAGGSTEFAALKRITIRRLVDGEQIEVRVRLEDPVQPDDTINVPVKFF